MGAPQPETAQGKQGHRASYILERGIWQATCRSCGWATRDLSRRQAATLFRLHIQESRVIDIDVITCHERARSEERSSVPRGA